MRNQKESRLNMETIFILKGIYPSVTSPVNTIYAGSDANRAFSVLNTLPERAEPVLELWSDGRRVTEIKGNDLVKLRTK
jgi:hypothetical protein